jgi:hypothetical protein
MGQLGGNRRSTPRLHHSAPLHAGQRLARWLFLPVRARVGGPQVHVQGRR